MVPASDEIRNLEYLFARLPGLGPKSARRAVLYMLKRPEVLMLPLRDALTDTLSRIQVCTICGNLDTADPCSLCMDKKRDKGIICVVENVADLWALQRIETYKGQFHVLGGVLSALDGQGPESLRVDGLVKRALDQLTVEIVLALPLTVDGQTTVYYLKDLLENCNVSITQLAHGVPVGGDLDYLDDGTITTALNTRRPI